MVITVPADVLAPNGARPSADTVLIEKSYIYIHIKYLWFQWFCNTCMDWLMIIKIENGCQDLHEIAQHFKCLLPRAPFY